MDNSSASISPTQVLSQVHTRHKTSFLTDMSIGITLDVVQEPERGSCAISKGYQKELWTF